MEGALTARDRVGIQDFVLLDETTEAAVINNLKKRFSKDLIYVSLRDDQRGPKFKCALNCGMQFLVFFLDLHRHAARVRQPLQGAGHLQQETDGHLHGCQLF